MRRKARWIQDALDAVGRIGGYTDPVNLPTYLNDRLRRNAVERNFITIGEALARLRDHAPEPARRIHLLDEIRRFWNRLTREYDAISPEQNWAHIQNNLPGLELPLLAEFSDPEPPQRRKDDEGSSFGP